MAYFSRFLRTLHSKVNKTRLKKNSHNTQLLERMIFQDEALDFECEKLENRTMLSTVKIFAAGSTGDEIIDLEVAGQVVQTFNNLGNGEPTGTFVELTYETNDDVSADDVRISFINDVYDLENGIDNNVRIDAIEIDGIRFETEDPSVFSTGTWTSLSIMLS